MSESLGKKAEGQIKRWLDRPEDGYSFNRLYDQMTGYYMVSRNPCDFICYKYPYMYYIEAKETEKDRFEFRNITQTQHDELLKKEKIPGCFGIVIILFTSYKRTFIVRMSDIAKLESQKKMSLNILKESKWGIPHAEIPTIPNSRKLMLDYVGELDEIMQSAGLLNIQPRKS